MTVKPKRTKAQERTRMSIYRHVLLFVLVFCLFAAFDMADGDPAGLRGLAEFVRLWIGS